MVRQITNGDETGYWIYMLLCENNTYYTGYTVDLIKRYQSHLNGTGKCKYTRSFQPIEIAQCWRVLGSKSLAMQLECFIKKLTRLEKEQIIAYPSLLSKDERVCIISKEVRQSMASLAINV